MRLAPLVTILIAAQFAHACPIGKQTRSAKDLKKLKAELAAFASRRKKERGLASTARMPVLPTAEATMPWGGASPSLWRPEAILANAVSRELNEAWARPGTLDVLVSVPVTMVPTDDRVYGDGQTNATLNFGDRWPHREPQMTATLVTTALGSGLGSGLGRTVYFRFSSQLIVNNLHLDIATYENQTKKLETIELQRAAPGKELTGKWVVPTSVRFGTVAAPFVTWLSFAESNEVFPLDFRFPIYATDVLAKAAGSAKTAGRPPLDPMQIRERAKKSGALIEGALVDTPWTPEWRIDGKFQLRNEAIHGRANNQPTAVGGGDTWLVLRPSGNTTFKNLYTCFDARNEEAESKNFVPSGGGWHEIGDAAETIINNLEDAPIPVGYATGAPQVAGPDGKSFAFGNRDVATVRFLQPGEAMMTGAGKTTWEEDRTWRKDHGVNGVRGKSGELSGRNYHWFFFPFKEPVCTQEWVHPCLPSENNNFGLEPRQDESLCSLLN